MESIDIISELNMCKGYKVALLSTYTSDINLINRVIVPRLLEFGCNKIVLFTDRRMLAEKLMNDSNISLGSKYIINPIKTDYAFHPKVFLLLGETTAKLLIGSGNLTCAGMLKNTEIFNKYEYSPTNSEQLSIIQSAFKMFEKIASQNPYPLQSSVLNVAKSFPYLNLEAQKDDSVFWFDNCRLPIAEQLAERLQGQVSSCDIIVPYFDSKSDAVKRLIPLLDIEKYRIFIQNGNSNFKPNNGINNTDVFCFDSFNGGASFYHAKTFVLHCEDKDYILYGSANCSTQALFATADNGNYEACILEKGDKGEFDYFVNSIEHYSEFNEDTYISIGNSQEYQHHNISFEYAVLKSNLLEVSLTQNIETNIDNIQINGKVVPMTQSGNKIHLLVENPLEIIKESAPFDIYIHEEKNEAYRIAGWYLDEQEIFYIHENKEEIIKQKIVNGQWDNDISCILEIIREFQEKSCWDYNKMAQTSSYLKRKQELEKEISEEVNSNSLDYIVDDTIGEDYSLVSLEKHRSIINLFYEYGLTRLMPHKTMIKYHGPKAEQSEAYDKSIVDHEYSDYDVKWLSKQLKSLTQVFFGSLKDERFIVESEWDDFWEKSIAVLEFFHRLLESQAYLALQEKYNDLLTFNTRELIQMQVALIDAILKYKKDEVNSEELKQTIYNISIYAMVWTYYDQNEISDDSKVQSRKILQIIRKLSGNDSWLRDNYMTIARFLEGYEILGVHFDGNRIVECFENAFDYHSIRSAIAKLKTIFGQPFDIENSNALKFIVKNVAGEEINLRNGKLREKIKSALSTIRKVAEWENCKSIEIVYIAKIGTIREFQTDYEIKTSMLRETIQYINGNRIQFEWERIHLGY